MKQKWKDFAQRRKINLEMFRDMNYSQYTRWCTIRKVEPVSQESYEGVQRLLTQDQPNIGTTTVKKTSFEIKELKKMKKDELLNLCEKFDVEFAQSDTKRVIVDKLIALNNEQN